MFGDALESCTQQLSTAQTQSEAIRHILLPSPRGRWQILRLLITEGVPLPLLPLPLAYSSSPHPGLSVERAAGRPPSLYQSLPSQVATVRLSVPDTGCPGTGERALQMVTVPPLALWRSSGTPIVTRANSSVPGPQEGQTGGVRPCKALHPSVPSCVASRQPGTVQGPDYAFSCNPCRSLESGKCCFAHSDLASGRLQALRARSLSSTPLPPSGYVCVTSGLSLWTPGESFPAGPAGSSVPSDSYTQFSSSSVRPSSAVFCTLQCCPNVPLSCVRR
ncbi:hypothetical protein PO909_016521 [Leuciscus waleckii]